MGHVVALLKRKGGSGSTTLAANVAAEWHSRGFGVVALDMDPQRSLTSWAELGEGGALQATVQGGDAQQGGEFRELVERRRGECDRMIIDCAPGFDPLALQAATLADCIVIPCRPSPIDVSAALDALELALFGAHGRDGVSIAFVPSANLPRTRLGRNLPAQLASFGAGKDVRVLPSISGRIVIAEASIHGQAVREFEPGGDSALEFSALVDALEDLLVGKGGDE